MKFKPKEIAVPALILCAICLIITGALSVTNFITKDTIEALNLQTEKEARTVVLPDAANFEAGDSEERRCDCARRAGCLQRAAVRRDRGAQQ